MSNRTHWKWRIGVALSMGLLIVALTLWPLSSNGNFLVRHQLASLKRLQKKDRHILDFRARRHRLPATLAELYQAPFENDARFDNGGEEFGSYDNNHDAWDQPIIYTVRGDRYTLTSYGADGKPGGVGLDMDLTSDMTSRNLPPPMFLQLAFHPLARGFRFSALVCGFFTFLLTLLLLHARDFDGPAYSCLVIKLAVILMAASFVALIMSAVHVSSGH